MSSKLPDLSIPAIALAMLASAGIAGSAGAQERSPDWAAQITPYIWASGIGGTITPFRGAPSIEIDKSFSDVLEDLDAAFFIAGYARRDRFVLVSDLSYVSSSRSGDVAIPGVGSTRAKGKLKQTLFTLVGGYRVVDEPTLSVDLLGGLRAWWIRGSVDIGGGAISRSPSEDFVDPILAARANMSLTPRWSLILYGDIGGFGVGSESTGQLLAAVNYQLAERFFLSLGYRHLQVDRRNSGVEIDMRMSGPLLGATWRF